MERALQSSHLGGTSILPPERDAGSRFVESAGAAEGNGPFDALLYCFIGRHAGTEPKPIEIGCVKEVNQRPNNGFKGTRLLFFLSRRLCEAAKCHLLVFIGKEMVGVYRTVGVFSRIFNYAKGSIER